METNQRHFNRGNVPTGYDIDNSLILQHTSDEWIYRDGPTSGNRKTFTFSFWFKRASISVPATNYIYDQYFMGQGTYARFHFAGNTVRFMFEGSSTELEADQQLTDPNAWYHFILAVDTTQGTAADRVKAYLNGNAYEWNNSDYPSEDDEDQWMHDQDLYIGGNGDASGAMSTYFAEFVVIDGQQLTPSSFGETDSDSGIWKPKDVSGLTFGDEGFWLKFDDSASMGADSSGNGNDCALTNVDATNQSTDTPTNNFCTFNMLINQNNSPAISDGSMKSTGTGAWNQTWGSLGVQNGKWYYEFKVANAASSSYFGASTTPAEGSNTTGAQLMYNTSFMVGNPARIDYYYWQSGAQVSNEGTGWGTISTDDIIGIALDLDASTKTFTIYKNGTALSGTLSQPVDLPTNMQDEFVFPLYVQYSDKADEANFGGYTISSISSAATDENGYGTFEIAPPSGYYALCTKNIAEFG